MIDRLVRALRVAGMATGLAEPVAAAGGPGADDRSLTPEQLRDLLWLALQLPAAGPATAGTAAATGTPAGAVQAAGGGQAPARPPAPPPAAAAPPQAASAAVYAGGSATGTLRAGVLRLRGVSAAPSPMALRRALQPLARRVPSASRQVLDEEASAEQRAETGRWQLVLRPLRERWFDLNLVQDSGASMALWRDELAGLQRALRAQGGFRSLRSFVLAGPADGSGLQLARRPGGPAATASALLPAGHRPLTLLVTDAGAAHWRNGQASAWLHAQAARAPLALLQLLPRRLWRHTPLGEPDLAAFWGAAGLPNTRLQSADGELLAAQQEGWRAIPGLGLDAASLRQWARASTGRRDTALPAWLMAPPRAATPPAAGVPAAAPSAAVAGSEPPPAERVARYRRRVSPAAYELAVFLAVPDPLTVPVMRLVQRTMLPDSSTAELAEFFLGGLLLPLPVGGRAVAGAEPTPVAAWRLYPGVRDELLRGLRFSEEDRITEQLQRVGRALTQAVDGGGSSTDVEAWFPDPQGRATLAEWAMPFAEVSRSILRGAAAASPAAVGTDEPAAQRPGSAGAAASPEPSGPTSPPVGSAQAAAADAAAPAQPPFAFLDGAAVVDAVRLSGRLAGGDLPVDRMLLFATGTQQTWLVFSRRALVLVLDDADTRQRQRLVQRVIGHRQAQPVDARVDRDGTATVAVGPGQGRWYYSPQLFATPQLLEEAVRERLRAAAQPAPKPARPTVFISYARADAVQAEHLARRLEAVGLDAWQDLREVSAGDDWIARIDAAIDQARAAIVLVGKGWEASTQAQRETARLLARQRLDGAAFRIIPVLLQGRRVPPALAHLQALSVGDEAALLAALKGLDIGPGPDAAAFPVDPRAWREGQPLALAAGAQWLVFAPGVPVIERSLVARCLLLATLVAEQEARASEPADDNGHRPDAATRWSAQLGGVLANLGFVETTLERDTWTVEPGPGNDYRQMRRLSLATDPQAPALPSAVLRLLQQQLPLDEAHAPWWPDFDTHSRHDGGRRWLVAQVERAPEGGLQLRLFAYVLDAPRPRQHPAAKARPGGPQLFRIDAGLTVDASRLLPLAESLDDKLGAERLAMIRPLQPPPPA